MTQRQLGLATHADERFLHFEGRAMASLIGLTAVVGSGERGAVAAEMAWSGVVDEFAASDLALSRFREDSEISALNRASLRGDAVAVGRRLAAAAHACDRSRRLTGGRFDPRVIGQLDAWGYRGASLGAPISTAIAGAPERIVERVDRGRIRLPHPIDLGGIGKGLAVRWATDRVLATGVERFLLDAGGDIATCGEAPEGGPWLVGIEDPTGGDDPLAVVAVQDGAVATSSIRRLRWTTDGGERHHIVDPRTGEPADGGLLAVTVAAADPAWAEVWSKALFVAGRVAIRDEARARGLAAWWVDENGGIEMSAAARHRTTWVAGEA